MRHPKFIGVYKLPQYTLRPGNRLGNWLPDRWQAVISEQGKSFAIGVFALPEEAAHAFDNVAIYLPRRGKKPGTLAAVRELNFPREHKLSAPAEKTERTKNVLAKIATWLEKKAAQGYKSPPLKPRAQSFGMSSCDFSSPAGVAAYQKEYQARMDEHKASGAPLTQAIAETIREQSLMAYHAAAQ